MIHHLFCLATVLIKPTYSNNMLFIIRGNYVKIVFVHGYCTPTSDFVSRLTGQRLWREAAILIVEHILFPWDIVSFMRTSCCIKPLARSSRSFASMLRILTYYYPNVAL